MIFVDVFLVVAVQVEVSWDEGKGDDVLSQVLMIDGFLEWFLVLGLGICVIVFINKTGKSGGLE